MPHLHRRSFLGALGAASLLRGAAPTQMQLSMPNFGMTDAGLTFVKQMGVQWITMGGPGAPTYSPEGRVIPFANDPSPVQGPWNEPQIRQIKERIESFGLNIGIMMLHDFRDAILGR
ncbi:MAG TPA: hypothetical protein VER03_04865, partial [Bryobacteraceae bacterium]|nr:hypothetical protein [Bryobacteraceae bacterium]